MLPTCCVSSLFWKLIINPRSKNILSLNIRSAVIRYENVTITFLEIELDPWLTYIEVRRQQEEKGARS